MKRELEDYEEGDSLPEEILATVVGEVTAPTSTAIVVGDSEAPSAAKSARIVTYPTNVSTYSVPVASAPSSLPFHCFNCKSILSTRKSYKAHLKTPCGNRAMGCNQDHEHDAIQFSFYDEAEAVNWFRNQELDQYFIINDSKPNGYRMYKCNQSKCTMRKGYKYTTDKGSKKTEDCQARISMRKCTLCHCGPSTTGEECHSAQEVYVASGCLTHSHPVDMKKVRVSDVTKSYIVNLLQSGIKVKEIVKRCQNDPAISKLCKGGITYQTVAHLQRKYVKKTKKEPKDGDENSAEETAEEGDDDDKNDEDDDFMDPINDTAANEFKFSNILDASRYSYDLDQARILKKLQEISAFLRSKGSSKDAKQKLMNEVRDTVMNANVPSVLMENL